MDCGVYKVDVGVRVFQGNIDQGPMVIKSSVEVNKCIWVFRPDDENIYIYNTGIVQD